MSDNNRSKNTAVYITADPMTNNDIDMVKKSIEAFGFINILLDRQNKDTFNKRYYLNCTDRSNIIVHDLKAEGVTAFKILPIDTTLKETVEQNDIKNIVLNFDQQQQSNFKMQDLIREVCNDVNIVLIKADGYVEDHYIKELVAYDHSLVQPKKHCSPYAFSMLKIKTTKKYCLTRNFGTDLGAFEEKLRENYLFIDIDDYINNLFSDKEFISKIQKELKKKNNISYVKLFSGSKEMNMQCIANACAEDDDVYKIVEKQVYTFINQQIAKWIVNNYNDEVIVKFSMVYELAMEKVFDCVICANEAEDSRDATLAKKGYDIQTIAALKKIQLPIEEKASYADYVVSFPMDKAQQTAAAQKLMSFLKKAGGFNK